ncbi:MAG: antitoxin [Deltaproteobacteria bacterium]|nr:antitoxin [Deltaproteobacteria bacterium]
MRLSVNLEDDLYAIAKSLASAERCSISEAVNRLVRRGLTPPSRPSRKRSGFPVVRGARPISSDEVYRIEGDEG